MAIDGDGLRVSKTVADATTETFLWDVARRIPRVVSDEGSDYLWAGRLIGQTG